MTVGQSKLRSFWEAISNTVIGFLLTLAVSPLIYHLVGISYTNKQLGVVTLLFTVVSIVRGFIVRRVFNKHEEDKDIQLVEEAKYWKDLVKDILKRETDMYEMNKKERIDALTLIHEYKIETDLLINIINQKDIKIYQLEQELRAAKQAFQHFVADAVEQGHLLDESIEISNKREVEDDCKTHEDGEYGSAREGGNIRCF